MQNQKHLFQLDPDVHYLNCAYMSPQLHAAEQMGISGMKKKRNPSRILPQHFFEESAVLRNTFASLIGGSASQVAIIPSSSYGLGNAISNVPFRRGQHALTIEQEFPSDIFPLRRWCEDHGAELRSISPEKGTGPKGEEWNQRILEAINSDTAMLVMSSVHWMNGIRFDLERIGARCREVGARFIVDGTQSVGALPIDVEKFHIDALICSGYKWLLGPYSIGMAYYGEAFDTGRPLEESWMNRNNAVNFKDLSNYEDHYTAGAGRYNVGEFSNFILVPMLLESLRQIQAWGVDQIQAYCKELVMPLLAFSQDLGGSVEPESTRAYHMMGLSLPPHIDTDRLLRQFQQEKIVVSVRGSSIRVAPHLYNTSADIDVLMTAIKNSLG